MVRYLIPFFVFLTLPFVAHARANFKDRVEIPQWAEVSVEALDKENIMTGFGDGTFRPWKNINRAEVVTLIFRVLGDELPSTVSVTPFPDVPAGAWFAPAVVQATERGWVKGTPDGNFYPARELNRAEFAVLLSRAFPLEDKAENPSFKDVPTREWYGAAAGGMFGNGLIRNTRSKFFHPGELVTRADAAWVFAQVLKKPRFLGTSARNSFKNNRRRMSRRVAIKPRGFKADLQGYNIQRKEINLNATKAKGEVRMHPSEAWVNLGSFMVQNHLENRAVLDTLEFKLRFEEGNAGPAENFSLQVVEQRDGVQNVVRELFFSKTGTLAFMDMKSIFESGDGRKFGVRLRANNNRNYFPGRGSGYVWLFAGSGTSYANFKRYNSRRVRSIQFAPVGFGDRNFASFTFTP